MDATGEAIVELTNVHKKFGREDVVNGVSLSLSRGKTLGLIGPNGAGKSTLIRMLMGLVRPTSGKIRLFGRELASDWVKIRRRIGYVPDACQIYPWMTVAQALRFSQAAYPSWSAQLCEELLDQFRVPMQARIRNLSLGMRAKLLLLIALAPDPELLVMDEPLSGLDPIARDEFIEAVLYGVCSGERTILISSHQLDEIGRLADEVAILNHGRLLVHQSLEVLGQSIKQVRAVLLDGRLPQTIPTGAIHQTIKRREWRLTLPEVNEEILAQIRAENPVVSVDVFDVSLDELFRDFVQGDDVRNGSRREETVAC